MVSVSQEEKEAMWSWGELDLEGSEKTEEWKEGESIYG